MEKKILIIDDERESIGAAFDFANSLSFNNELIFEYKAKSQEVDFDHLRDKYDLVIVDITLANRSLLDGYGILKKINDQNLFDFEKMFVLTGNSQVKTEIKNRNLPSSIRVVTKPVTFTSLAQILKEYLD